MYKMRNNLNSRDERMDGLSPDPMLRELLSSAYPAEDILPWARLEALVESAPAVRPGFAARWQFALGGQRSGDSSQSTARYHDIGDELFIRTLL